MSFWPVPTRARRARFDEEISGIRRYRAARERGGRLERLRQQFERRIFGRKQRPAER
jgi:hypothetical protein